MNLGSVYFSIRNYDKAMACYRQYLSICEQQEDKKGIGVAQGSMGMVYQAKGDHAQALEHYSRAIDTAKDLRVPADSCVFMLKKANLLFTMNKFEHAGSVNDEALQTATQLGFENAIFQSSLLRAKLAAVADKQGAIHQLNDMLPNFPKSAMQAEIFYQLFTLTHTAGHRNRAAALYRALYDQYRNAAYKERLQELDRQTAR